MEALRQYLLSVIGAALVCGVVVRLLPQKGTVGTIGKMLAGIFLAFTLLRPLGSLTLLWAGDWTLELEAAEAVQTGREYTNTALREVIKEKTQAYILDKAQALGLNVEVEVTVSQEELPVPTAVWIRGNVGPYAKTRLQAILEADLGIAKEKQTWS